MSLPDVCVVGAGIVGAAIAHQLRRAGCRVAVLDARLPAATDAGMGHLVTMDDDAAEFALARASMRIWREWRERMPAACAFRETGTLWLAVDEAEAEEARRKQQRLHTGGVASDWLDASALRRAEPALAPDLIGGLRVPGDALVYAPAVARWLLQSATGGAIEPERAEVTAIEPDGALRLADGSRRDAGITVLATGVHTRRLCPELPVMPKKGHLVITDRYPGTVQHQLVELGYVASTQATSGVHVACNVQPRPTGQLLIGSSRQFDSEDASVDAQVLARMLRRALRFVPALAGLNAIRSWSGARPATPDGLPIIGAHPWRKRLWLAVGHEGLGVTTAPATAALVVAALTGARMRGGMSGALPGDRPAGTPDAAAETPINPDPYRAERFALDLPALHESVR